MSFIMMLIRWTLPAVPLRPAMRLGGWGSFRSRSNIVADRAVLLAWRAP